MAIDKKDKEIFVTILRVRKGKKRADLYSIYKEIKKSLDFEDITKEFLDNRMYTLINDGKIINKLNRHADSYYVNSEVVHLEMPDLLNSSQTVQRISLTPNDSLSNWNDTPALGASKTTQSQRVTLTPTIYLSNSS